jgi:hypothetical protein
MLPHLKLKLQCELNQARLRVAVNQKRGQTPAKLEGDGRV